MKNKWLEYFKTIPSIYFVACVFDPHKLDGLHDYLKAYYEILQVDEDVYDLFSKIKKEIYALYNEYSGVYNSSINNPGNDQTSSKVEDTSKLSRIQQLLLQRAKKPWGSSSSSNTELDSYLTTSF